MLAIIRCDPRPLPAAAEERQMKAGRIRAMNGGSEVDFLLLSGYQLPCQTEELGWIEEVRGHCRLLSTQLR